MPRVESQTLSLVLHALAIALLVLSTSRNLVQPVSPKRRVRIVYLRPAPVPQRPAAGAAGGSNVSPTPATRGAPPPRSYRTFILPPAQREPKLSVPVTISFDAPPVITVSAQYGDPLAPYGPASLGMKGGGGIGNAPGCCGIGDQAGRPGVSGRFDEPVKPPRLIYRVEPEFSEEARKAKFQGMVVLMIEVGVDGRADNIKVVEPAGLGLDQKAIQAVAQWRFQPALRGGKPFATTARVEVFFHLL